MFGGCSVEHEISLISARSIIKNIDTGSFNVLPVFISKSGKWLKIDLEKFIQNELDYSGGHCYIPSLGFDQKPRLFELEDSKIVGSVEVDLAFPVLHGTYGEDGTIQGLFELMGLPYVGASVLGSAIGMDKIAMKSVLKNYGLPVTDFIGFNKNEWENNKSGLCDSISSEIGFDCFVKAADLGSSIGISKVKKGEDVPSAVADSFKYSERVLVEKAVDNCREIEVSVLGNDEPLASLPGEVTPEREFYDYIAKYDDDSTSLQIPAKLSEEIVERLRYLAVETFKALDCSGLGRVDFLIDDKTKDIFISEINTIPGFTSISMYPKLWEVTGISYGDLINRLLELALKRFDDRKLLETDYDKSI